MRSFADVGVRVTIGTTYENERVLAVLDSAREAGLI
jgi:histidinol-phosphate/aromatic aminotransferase/cobyric acid decarboxylase-like protein